jgi:hypothetical protein
MSDWANDSPYIGTLSSSDEFHDSANKKKCIDGSDNIDSEDNIDRKDNIDNEDQVQREIEKMENTFKVMMENLIWIHHIWLVWQNFTSSQMGLFPQKNVFVFLYLFHSY